MGFPTKNAKFWGVKWGYHHFRKPPFIKWPQFLLAPSRALLKATSFEAKMVSAQHSSEQKNLPFLGFNNVHGSKMQVLK